MMTGRCAHEDAIRRMIQERRDNPMLVTHAATCESCRVTLELAGGLRDLASRAADETVQTTPSASYLWWKAELLRQFDAQARVVEPVEIGERFGVGVALAGAAILLVWLWRQADAWTGSTTGLLASLPWLTTAALVVCTLLLGTAAALAVVNLASWNRKE